MKKSFHFFIIIFCSYLTILSVSAEKFVVPGGQVIGLELETENVTVAAVDELYRTKHNELQPGDEILAINKSPIHSISDVQAVMKKLNGKAEIKVMRNGQIKFISFLPEATSSGPKLGVYLRQGISGIGTVTWYDPECGAFGALGHGVNDKRGKLMQISDGTVYSAVVENVKVGKSGVPGQLHGKAMKPIGQLLSNKESGVYGKIDQSVTASKIETASWDEIKIGDAVIRSTISNSSPKEYHVEIKKLYRSEDNSGKNFLIEVTDPALLSATGGIICGMSGSPIIQNGKLIGAVTHVFTNDPTMGYGIFIENMIP